MLGEQEEKWWDLGCISKAKPTTLPDGRSWELIKEEARMMLTL